MSVNGLSVTNFAVQYSNADAAEIAASGHDLVIVEAAPGRPAGTSDLSDAEVASLVAQGIEVIGYVSVGQTDDARPYWDPAWTDDGTDTGNPTAAAPSWMAEAAESWPARIVEYWDPDWKAIVLEQVVEIATRGYSGIFLDNILSYYEIAAERGELGTAQSELYAQDMIDLVIEIAAAGRAVNPGFAVIANGGPYILGDAAAFGTARVAQYMDAVDGIMAESFFGLLEGEGVRQENVLDTFETFWAANGIDVLALEYSTDQAAIDAYVAEALERGFAPSISPDQALNTLPTVLVGEPPEPEPEPEPEPTEGLDYTDGNTGSVIDGTGFADTIKGAGGDDVVRGAGGGDSLYGGADDDALYGGRGNDRLSGGSGEDLLVGNDGADVLLGGISEDELSGGKGRDTLKGQGADDVLYGGEANDALFGGGGNDDLFGGNGNDRMNGGSGRDNLYGGRGNDKMQGGSGADVLAGGKGDDEMTGGGGADTFVFNKRGTDTITDYTIGRDAIEITGADDFRVRDTADGVTLIFDNGSKLKIDDLTPAQVDDLVFV